MHTVFGQPEENPQRFADNWGWKNASTDWEQWSARRKSAWSTWSRRTTCTRRWPGRPSPPASPFPAKSRSPARWLTPEPWSRPPKRPRSRRSSGSTIGAARPWPWLINWSRRVSSGRLYHVRATYLQDWAGESVPLLWRFDKNVAGSGAHGDLNAHIVDMTRFVTGQEITEVAGAIAETFIKERSPHHRGSHGRDRRRSAGQRRQRESHRRRYGALPRPFLRRGRGQLRGRPAGHRQPEPQRLRDQRQ